MLPLVLYNGDRPWRAPTNAAELIEPVPGGLEHYRPQLNYLLLDEGALEEHDLPSVRNLAAALFRLERSRRPADLREVITALAEWLAAPEQTGLRRAFTVWIRRVLLPRRVPGAEIPEVTDLQEVNTTLSEREIDWSRDWREQGLAEGRQEGRQKGEAAVLMRLIERRFGALDEAARQRIADADAETLLLWGENVLTGRERRGRVPPVDRSPAHPGASNVGMDHFAVKPHRFSAMLGATALENNARPSAVIPYARIRCAQGRPRACPRGDPSTRAMRFREPASQHPIRPPLGVGGRGGLPQARTIRGEADLTI